MALKDQTVNRNRLTKLLERKNLSDNSSIQVYFNTYPSLNGFIYKIIKNDLFYFFEDAFSERLYLNSDYKKQFNKLMYIKEKLNELQRNDLWDLLCQNKNSWFPSRIDFLIYVINKQELINCLDILIEIFCTEEFDYQFGIIKNFIKNDKVSSNWKLNDIIALVWSRIQSTQDYVKIYYIGRLMNCKEVQNQGDLFTVLDFFLSEELIADADYNDFLKKLMDDVIFFDILKVIMHKVYRVKKYPDFTFSLTQTLKRLVLTDKTPKNRLETVIKELNKIPLENDLIASANEAMTKIMEYFDLMQQDQLEIFSSISNIINTFDFTTFEGVNSATEFINYLIKTIVKPQLGIREVRRLIEKLFEKHLQETKISDVTTRERIHSDIQVG